MCEPPGDKGILALECCVFSWNAAVEESKYKFSSWQLLEVVAGSVLLPRAAFGSWGVHRATWGAFFATGAAHPRCS